MDDKSNDVVLDAEGVPHFNTAAVLRAKAQVETRLRLLASWDSRPIRTRQDEVRLFEATCRSPSATSSRPQAAR